MSGAPKDYYTSMVYKSNYRDTQPPFAMGAVPKKHIQPYRIPFSSSQQSINNNTLPDGSVSSMAPSAPTTVQQAVYAPSRPHGYETCDAAKPTGKLYTHNPYASSCTTPLSGLSLTSGVDSFTNAHQGSYTPSTTRSSNSITTPHSTAKTTRPVYAASEASGGGETGVLTSTLEEQFLGVVGSIAATAMSSRGRHLLLSVLRLQHVDKIQMIYDEIAPQFNVVAVDQHGCHVVRTLMEYVSNEQMEALVPLINPAVVLQMATATQHTRRVLQAIFEHHKAEGLMPLVQIVKSNCKQLSMTQQGCIVIIRVVEYALPAQKRALINELVPILPDLATDQFGNYVVQCILKNMDGYISLEDLVESFQGHWVELSCDKYSSNVMERIIGMLRGHSRQRIVNELIFDVPNLHRLMQNNFGNYVLQAVIGSAVDQYEFKRIYDAVIPFLHTSPYGHRIEAKLKGRYDVLYKNASMGCCPVDASPK
ncbi:hypothetical protein ABL78_7423 [Leptomonas seymouri]|uniref:PUM-HD domain-containing protein n=1 Tax=Leptomonas seymouri TaxID=5684 RepID=A0A0N1HSE0_LEPSE|nr:hypothetical protein ABL78_7423 [Leptomonas seymouri]|eukprot:KPI83538.1 hypothetical protein ABL78_7423 [Leptomonas seymouri]